MITHVYHKDHGDISGTISVALNAGETITAITLGPPTPHSSNPPTLTINSGNVSPIQFVVSGGEYGVSYGFPISVKTNQRVIGYMVAVCVKDPSLNPYKNEDPDAYQDLVGDLPAGKSALGTAIFQFPPSFDVSGGYVVWDLLDSQGVVHSSGNAYEYRIVASGVSNTVVAKCVINVPSNVPPSIDNPYQLRYTCYVQDKVAYSYENLNVVGFPEMQVGAQDSIEMQGDIATLSLVTEELYKNYTLEIWQDNTLISSMSVGNAEQVSSGYFVAGSVDTSKLAVSLIPYNVVWKFWDIPAQTYREACALWIVNPTIINAIEDVKSKVNKARQTLYGTPDSQFPSTEIMKWLRRAMDAFNGAYGVFTNFSMTNAKSGIREFWLLYAEKFALESQYLLEGEKSFNFSGAAISLDVDRTGFLDAMASKIQGVLDQEVKPLKQNLTNKGYTSGDGSGINGNGDMSATARGALAAVGLLISPVSLYSGGYTSRFRG